MVPRTGQKSVGELKDGVLMHGFMRRDRGRPFPAEYWRHFGNIEVSDINEAIDVGQRRYGSAEFRTPQSP